MKPMREVHRRLELERAAPHRADPVEDLHPGGNRDQHGGEREERVGDRAHAGGEHVVAPDPEAEEGDEHAGEHHRRVAEERLAGEDRQHLGDDAERRQDQDVDLGVAEDPEEVLPEDRIAPARRARRSGCRRTGRT